MILSGVYRAAHQLAVYASPLRSRADVQDSLAPGDLHLGRSGLPPAGCFPKFQVATYLPFRPGLSWRTVYKLEQARWRWMPRASTSARCASRVANSWLERPISWRVLVKRSSSDTCSRRKTDTGLSLRMRVLIQSSIHLEISGSSEARARADASPFEVFVVETAKAPEMGPWRQQAHSESTRMRSHASS